MKEFFTKLWNDETTFTRISKILISAGCAVATAYSVGVPISPELIAGTLGVSGVLGSVGSNGKAVS